MGQIIGGILAMMLFSMLVGRFAFREDDTPERPRNVVFLTFILVCVIYTISAFLDRRSPLGGYIAYALGSIPAYFHQRYLMRRKQRDSGDLQ